MRMQQFLNFNDITLDININADFYATTNHMILVNGSLQYVSPSGIIMQTINPNEPLYTKTYYSFEVSLINQLPSGKAKVEGGTLDFYKLRVFWRIFNKFRVHCFIFVVFYQSEIYSFRLEYESS